MYGNVGSRPLRYNRLDEPLSREYSSGSKVLSRESSAQSRNKIPTSGGGQYDQLPPIPSKPSSVSPEAPGKALYSQDVPPGTPRQSHILHDFGSGNVRIVRVEEITGGGATSTLGTDEPPLLREEATMDLSSPFLAKAEEAGAGTSPRVSAAQIFLDNGFLKSERFGTSHDANTAKVLQDRFRGESKESTTQDDLSRVATKFALSWLKKEEFGNCCVEKKTIYGAAFALPQIARSSGWATTFLALTVRTYIFLAMSIFLQVFLLAKIGVTEVLLYPFQGRMHLCSYAAAMPQCALQSPQGPGCKGPGGTDLQNLGRLYDYDTWKLRVFWRDMLVRLYPDRAAEIHQAADPGEYGVEDDYCRMACVLLFMMVLMDDLTDTIAMARTLFHLPSEAGCWIHYEVPELRMPKFPWMSNNNLSEKELTKRLFGKSELDFVKFRIAGMPLHWKVINIFLLLVPKTMIWASLSTIGVANLMETAGIMDLVVNAMAMTFIIKIDDLAFSRLTCVFTKHIMATLKMANFADATEEDSSKDSDGVEGYLSPATRHGIREASFLRKLWLSFPRRFVSLLIAFAAFVYLYYCTNCERDAEGSWISQAIYLPSDLNPSFLRLMFGIQTTSADEEPVWTHPTTE